MSVLALGGFLQGLAGGYRAGRDNGMANVGLNGQKDSSLADRIGASLGVNTGPTGQGAPGAAMPGPAATTPVARAAQVAAPAMATRGAMVPAAPVSQPRPAAPALPANLYPSVQRAMSKIRGG